MTDVPRGPRSFPTNRRTLADRSGKPWSSTSSCQIAIALRLRPRPCSISSRQALAVGARLVGGGQPERSARAADGPPKSVDTSVPWPSTAASLEVPVNTGAQSTSSGLRPGEVLVVDIRWGVAPRAPVQG
jgi:hypothetical protein